MSRRRRWHRWIFPIAGLASLTWFLIRVLPKPSRAAYPCQRMAAPLASGFVLWLLGLLGSLAALGKARALFRRALPIPAVLCLIAGLALLVRSDRPSEPAAASPFVPADGPNTPIGLAIGAQPGRVVWIHDPNVTDWNGQTGTSWAHTSQAVVERMTSDALRWLAGQEDDAAAWDVLFRDLNRRRGRGDVGYQAGQRIAVKVNQVGSDAGGTEGRDTTPMAVRALLGNLIAHAGVAPADITIYDASFAMKDAWYNYVTNHGLEFVGMHFVSNDGVGAGRTKPVPDMAALVHFSLPTFGGVAYLPTCVTQADYVINMAVLKPHWLVGATLSGKNHFGSVSCDANTWSPEFLHPYMRGENGPVYGQYSCIVDLMGNINLGAKTVLYFLDGLYSPRVDQGSPPARWLSDPFNNNWTSSILMSQDPVALDSVGVDLLRGENAVSPLMYFVGDVDNYLHEAALAFNPPSGVLYNSDQADPASPFASLGVHEHWNNHADKLYSRNLCIGQGIELVRQAPAPALPADFDGDGKVSGRDFLIWQAHYPMPSGATKADGDANGDGKVNGQDFLIWQASYRPMP